MIATYMIRIVIMINSIHFKPFSSSGFILRKSVVKQISINTMIASDWGINENNMEIC